MVAHEPMRRAGTHFALACSVSVALAFAACSSSNPPSPSASARGSEVASTAAPAPTATPPSTLTPTALVAATPTPAPTPDITLPPAANRAQTIHLILRPGGDQDVSVRSLTGCGSTYCQGDYRLGDDPLFDAATGKQVGTLVYVEFVVKTGESLFHSPGNTFDLTGRGQIVFSETLYDDGSGRPATGAILGGTGEFLGARGYVVSQSLQGSGDFVINITK
jgi:hypothetical protein